MAKELAICVSCNESPVRVQRVQLCKRCYDRQWIKSTSGAASREYRHLLSPETLANLKDWEAVHRYDEPEL